MLFAGSLEHFWGGFWLFLASLLCLCACMCMFICLSSLLPFLKMAEIKPRNLDQEFAAASDLWLHLQQHQQQQQQPLHSSPVSPKETQASGQGGGH